MLTRSCLSGAAVAALVNDPQYRYAVTDLVVMESAAHAEIDNTKPLWTFDQKLAKQSDGTARLIVS